MTNVFTILYIYIYIYISLSMPSHLPNFIMLGDFNFPGIDWANPDLSCPYATPLISLSDCIFINQHVVEPTRKSNILDLIFSPDDFINSTCY